MQPQQSRLSQKSEPDLLMNTANVFNLRQSQWYFSSFIIYNIVFLWH